GAPDRQRERAEGRRAFRLPPRSCARRFGAFLARHAALRMPSIVWLAPAFVLAAAAALAMYRLGDAPLSTGGDEPRFATHAFAISSSAAYFPQRQSPTPIPYSPTPPHRPHVTIAL